MDCTFQTDAGRFNYRVGAIITSDLGLLVVSNSKEPLAETNELIVVKIQFSPLGI